MITIKYNNREGEEKEHELYNDSNDNTIGWTIRQYLNLGYELTINIDKKD